MIRSDNRSAQHRPACWVGPTRVFRCARRRTGARRSARAGEANPDALAGIRKANSEATDFCPKTRRAIGLKTFRKLVCSGATSLKASCKQVCSKANPLFDPYKRVCSGANPIFDLHNRVFPGAILYGAAKFRDCSGANMFETGNYGVCSKCEDLEAQFIAPESGSNQHHTPRPRRSLQIHRPKMGKTCVLSRVR